MKLQNQKNLLDILTFFLYYLSWSAHDVDDFDETSSIYFPITKLKPYTQYAYYVKASIVPTEKHGAQSEIRYFKTLPEQPSPPLSIETNVTNDSEIVKLITKKKMFLFKSLNYF